MSSRLHRLRTIATLMREEAQSSNISKDGEYVELMSLVSASLMDCYLRDGGQAYAAVCFVLFARHLAQAAPAAELIERMRLAGLRGVVLVEPPTPTGPLTGDKPS